MSNRIPHPLPDPAGNGAWPPRSQADEGGLRAPPGLGPWGKFWWWLKFWLFVKTARLRFIAVLVAVGGVIAYWDTLKAHYEKWTRPMFGAEVAVSPDTEFWCPMHPSVVRDHADKCPICGMPLSKRKKGDKDEEEPLPPGVISRVQLSPYRIALAGIQTWEVDYRMLTKEIRTVGFVEFDERRLARITARVTGKSRIDKLYVNVTGQMLRQGDPVAELYSPDLVVTVANLLDARRSGNGELERGARDRLRLWGIEGDQIDDILKTGRRLTHVTIRAPISGHVIKKYQVEGEYVDEGARLLDVADLSTVWIEAQVYEDELAFLKKGLQVRATTKAYPSRTFEGTVAFVHPHLDVSTRTLRVRFDMNNHDHNLRPGMYATVTLELPTTQLDLFTRVLAEDWRDRTVADAVAHGLVSPTGLSPLVGVEPLTQMASAYAISKRGLVLAIPETAVIDTGTRKIVYRVAEPGVYEGVEVQFGPRSGGLYPVLHGLERGEKVATAGSFLIDAETRLSGGAGSTYFGAAGGPQAEKRSGAVRPSTAEDEEAKAKAVLAKLPAADQALAEAQKFCPVQKANRLGSMGRPVKVILKGQPVLLCCKGCVASAREHEDQTLDTVAKLRAGATPLPAAPTAAPAGPAKGDEHSQEQAEIVAALAKLPAADRILAEAQKFCPVQKDSPLGSMGVPVKVMLNGQPVFLCCRDCTREAQARPAQMLEAVQKLRAKASHAHK